MSANMARRRPASHESQPPGQALDEARAYLREALALPYETRDPMRWASQFRECVSGARRVLARRAAELRAGTVTHPRLIPLATRQEAAHDQLSELADALFTDAYILTSPDLLDMVNLAEAAKSLEREIAREHSRRSDVLFESTHRDIGGGG